VMFTKVLRFPQRSLFRAFSSTPSSVVGDKLIYDVQPFTLHKCDGPSDYKVVTTKEELLKMYKTMATIRRIEVASDALYKEKAIKGFLHLYNGQEAVCTGIESVLTWEDHIITAYRCHGWMYTRGGTAEAIFGELMGKETGVAGGKGGSMHMYSAKNNFHGGNGIVGAHVPVGAGVAWALKLQGKPNVCLSAYGDGAANQGQIFEAFNMAALWKVPAIFVIENNHFGMGTSAERAAGSTEFFRRGDFLPGIRVDGMDILSVKKSMEYARAVAVSGQPILVEYDTYRYVGHSMSDPGTSYRTRDDVKKVRDSRDPINNLKQRLLESNLTTEDHLKEMETEIRAYVDAAVAHARAASQPPISATFPHVYVEDSEVRHVELQNNYIPAKQ